MFQPDTIQYGTALVTPFVNPNPLKPETVLYTTPFEARDTVLDGLYDGVDGVVRTPSRLASGSVVVRGRFDVPVTVTLQQNLPVGGWTDKAQYHGFEFGDLVRLGPEATEIRLELAGRGLGRVELVSME